MTEITLSIYPPTARRNSEWLMPHRVAIGLIFIGLVILMVFTLRWDWIPQYGGMLISGVSVTLALLLSSCAAGFVLALLLGLAQALRLGPISWLAAGFCGIIRGTPLLLQIWLLYYGIGSLMAMNPEFRQNYPGLFHYMRQAWPYGFLSLTMSFAAYEGEVLRGAFLGVPRGELEAGKAFGMGRWKLFYRIWMPRALHRALPTLNGDMIAQMKSTPLVATITVLDVYGVMVKVRQDTFLTYEPLLLLTAIYLVLTGVMVVLFRYIESKVPVKT